MGIVFDRRHRARPSQGQNDPFSSVPKGSIEQIVDGVGIVYGDCGRYGALALPRIHVANADLCYGHTALNQRERIGGRGYHDEDPLAWRCGMNDIDGLLHREKPYPHAFWRRGPHGCPLARIRRDLIVDD